MTDARSRLDDCLIGELTSPVDPAIHALVAQILGPHRPLAVLFYGSGLRQFDPEGIFDFYIVLNALADWPASSMARVANHFLPPNVFFAEHKIGGRILRAKVALVTLSQFEAAATPRARDTSLWARFCQPVRLVWVRDSQAADSVLSVIRQCVVTAAGWAARLADGPLSAACWWQALFARTYRAELRVEKTSRSSTIMAGQEERYASLTRPAWALGGLDVIVAADGALSPRLSQRQCDRARLRWARMARQGRWRNVARLIKAAFTFRDGAAYLAWKIERHSGFRLSLSPFEARHPLLCLPRLLWRARKIFLSGMHG